MKRADNREGSRRVDKAYALVSLKGWCQKKSLVRDVLFPHVFSREISPDGSATGMHSPTRSCKTTSYASNRL